jgi:xylan 1,4-beta-xylosidase
LEEAKQLNSRFLFLALSIELLITTVSLMGASRPVTICNPLDLPYRFALKAPSYREAADPTVIYFKGEYWLFASKSGGYWHSRDFVHWSLVEPMGLPLESYAPTVESIDGKLYFTASNAGIYTTDDPAEGKWTLATPSGKVKSRTDPDLYLDDDGRLYLYDGCSNKTPIRGRELDRTNEFAAGKAIDLVAADPANRGFEGWALKIDGRVTATKPWIEGSWMNKVNGKYYLQYAAPGTQLDSYGDGVFVGDHPLGPFTYAPYSPFSFKPTGFARGAGHSSTFKDAKGNYWHISTITVSVRHEFERRLGVYPVKFFPDGQVACNTYLGDYPQYPPGVADDPFTSNSPGWMLLSLDKPVKVSSEQPKHPGRMAVDENIHDWWAAATGNPGEYLQVDLGSSCRIEALQINFADEGATQVGRLRNDAYRYLVEVSGDGTSWKTLADKRDNTVDAPQDYIQLDAPVMGRYLRVTNEHCPAQACFSISGLRIFGNALGTPPGLPQHLTAPRDPTDGRKAHFAWDAAPGAEFYVVRYGLKPDRLFTNYQVYHATSLDVSSLNVGVPYYATVDAVNASGITSGVEVISLP